MPTRLKSDIRLKVRCYDCLEKLYTQEYGVKALKEGKRNSTVVYCLSAQCNAKLQNARVVEVNTTERFWKKADKLWTNTQINYWRYLESIIDEA